MCVVHIGLGLQLNNKFVVCWSVLGACTDVSSPDDLFRPGLDVQGLDVLHIAIARVS